MKRIQLWARSVVILVIRKGNLTRFSIQDISRVNHVRAVSLGPRLNVAVGVEHLPHGEDTVDVPANG